MDNDLVSMTKMATTSALELRAEAGASPGKPFVIDDGVSRRLHLSADYVQSEMLLDQPYALHFAYTRVMMAFLLFLPRPKHVIIVGLGGGSLTKFCHRQLPRTHITTVEVSADVIGLSALFQVPPADERTRIVHADAVDYFATTDEFADVVLLDGCDDAGTTASFRSEAFYRKLHARLRPGGMLVANVTGSSNLVRAHLQLMKQCFAQQAIVVNLGTEGNQVVFAFKEPWKLPDWSAMNTRAANLAHRHGLDFPAFVRKLQRSYQRRPIASVT